MLSKADDPPTRPPTPAPPHLPPESGHGVPDGFKDEKIMEMQIGFPHKCDQWCEPERFAGLWEGAGELGFVWWHGSVGGGGGGGWSAGSAKTVFSNKSNHKKVHLDLWESLDSPCNDAPSQCLLCACCLWVPPTYGSYKTRCSVAPPLVEVG